MIVCLSGRPILIKGIGRNYDQSTTERRSHRILLVSLTKAHFDDLLYALLAADFRLQVLSDTVSWQPFMSRLNNLGMDLRLEIFAYRA
jgi:hypothetical protein